MPKNHCCGSPDVPTPSVLLLFVLLALSPVPSSAQARQGPGSAASSRFYSLKIRPILESKCISCHSGSAPSGGLLLVARESVLKGGQSGPAVRLDLPRQSLLLRAINYQGPQMPPSGKLPADQVQTLTEWVSMGAPWSSGDSLPPPSAHIPPPVNARTMSFWSFKHVRSQAIPAVRHKSWVRNPIDSFVLAKLEHAGLAPAPPADRASLLRRAYYDLTGLPPSPACVRAFLADRSPAAYEKLVDRLLASPAYGERWGRHWLDVVRYAETNSFERDSPKPFVWRYRDYVINAYNADIPYTQFIREQLAGDELPHPTRQSVIATGFYRLGQWDDEPADPDQARYDELDDVVTTTGQAFLGLTVNCARCHDHKIDPIPQRDYYRLLAFFQNITSYADRGKSVEESSLSSIASPQEQERFARESGAFHARLADLDRRIKVTEDSIMGDLSSVEQEDFKHEESRTALVQKRVPRLLPVEKFQDYVRLKAERSQLVAASPRGLEQALCVKEEGAAPPPTHVLLRGSPHAEGNLVDPGFLSVLRPPAPHIVPPANGRVSSGRRLALANWLASPDNPLTARVMVNRVWQHHFGRGIVRTPNNFGFLGDLPTHPEFLDWLAGELVKNGWRLKPLHRMMMLSSTYRMSSQLNAAALRRDPENNLFWRFDMRRLDAEEIRDSILAVNGTLNLEHGGPSVYPPIPAEVLAGQSRPGDDWPTSLPGEQTRRSIYVHVKRSLALPILASFDSADTDFTCPVRFATTQPTQALGLLNSSFVNEQARVLADSVQAAVGHDPAANVKSVLWRVLQRAPTSGEIARGVRFIRSLHGRCTEQEALTYFCVVALNLNEFIYLD